MIDFLIIGSGFAGAAMTVHLVEAGVDPKNINVVGPTILGSGNAFGCKHKDYRLNVRSEIMWIHPEKKNEFTTWAKRNTKDPLALHESGNFYRRADFAIFVHSKLKNFLQKKQLIHKRNLVKKIYKEKDGLWVSILNNQEKLTSKNIILATGNPIPAWPCHIEEKAMKQKGALIENPWCGNWVNNINKKDKILIIGTGLTALDCISALKSLDHEGQIILISKSGKFPPIQAKWERNENPNWPGDKNKELLPSTMIKFFKSYLPDNPPSTPEWQSAWEELRLDLNQHWNRILDDGKIKLKNKLYSTWSRFRYRASPHTISAKEYFIKNNQIKLYKGHVKNISLEGKDLFLCLFDGGKVIVDKVINCSGKGNDDLIKQIINDKLGVKDIFNETLKVDKNNKVIPFEEKENVGLYMIGPTLMESFGDAVAANKVSMQGLNLAKLLTNKIS